MLLKNDEPIQLDETDASRHELKGSLKDRISKDASGQLVEGTRQFINRWIVSMASFLQFQFLHVIIGKAPLSGQTSQVDRLALR